MTRYWVIAPAEYRDQDAFNRCWDYCRNNGVIAIGWDLGEAPRSQEHLEELFNRRAEEKGWSPFGWHMLRKFWFEIQPGDRIIARAGPKENRGHRRDSGQGILRRRSGKTHLGTQLPARPVG